MKKEDLKQYLEPLHLSRLLGGISTDLTRSHKLKNELKDLLSCPATPLLKLANENEEDNPIEPGRLTEEQTLCSKLLSVAKSIEEKLLSNPARILGLNKSRRLSILNHLECLADLPPTPVTTTPETVANTLRQWTENQSVITKRNALKIYFKELAMITLCQILLLKKWSDSGIRPWSAKDLSNLNWTLDEILKPHVPLNREGWQITRRNIYSWYNPSSAFQETLLADIQDVSLKNTSANLLALLLQLQRHEEPDIYASKKNHTYEERFHTAIWSLLENYGLQNKSQSLLPGLRFVFSPTLRDGSIIRTSKNVFNWVGLEEELFLLLVLELSELWDKGPRPPSLWTQGNGLEVNSKDQLSLELETVKPSLFSLISKMEACEFAFLNEEKILRFSDKTPDGIRIRTQIENLKSLKKLKGLQTSIGTLQACVSIQKLRPGGLLIWAREEPLSKKEGDEVLKYILERSCLIAEWDFSGVKHSLPTLKTLFPKSLYIFQREPDLQTRTNNRPVRITIKGTLRSHIELSTFLDDTVSSFSLESLKHDNLLTEDNVQNTQDSSIGLWKIFKHRSPLTQREWMEHWPNLTSQSTLDSIENLKQESSPLGSIVSIRALHSKDWVPQGEDQLPQALWVQTDYVNNNRIITALQVSKIQQMDSNLLKSKGFYLISPTTNWVAPLKVFLSSKLVHDWLDHHVEQKNGQWKITDLDIKLLPVPISLKDALLAVKQNDYSYEDTQAWDVHFNNIIEDPKIYTSVLKSVFQFENNKEDLSQDTIKALKKKQNFFKSILYVKTANKVQEIENKNKLLFNLIDEKEQINWKEFIKVLPPQEITFINTHNEIKITGNLPPNLPINHISKLPKGILLSTESGFQAQIQLSSNVEIFLKDIILAQLDGLQYPTWSELNQYLRVPKRVDFAKNTANEVLGAYSNIKTSIKELDTLCTKCLSL